MSSELKLIKVSTKDGPIAWPAWTTPVPGLVITPWVPATNMPGLPGDGWAVTQEVTGFKVLDVETPIDAWCVIGELGAVGDWTDVDTIKGDPDKREAVRSIVDAWKGRQWQ